MPSRPPPPREPFDVDEARKLYRELGSYAAVARRMGFATSTVARWLRPLKLERPNYRSADSGSRRIRKTWDHMMRSCRDPSYSRFRVNRPLGTDVAPKWEEYAAFRKWSLEHGWKKNLVLTRVDLARGFSPANCRWVARHEARRSGTPRRSLRAFGEEKGTKEWTRDPRCRVGFQTLRRRLNGRWPPEEAIALPPSSRPSRYLRSSKGTTMPRTKHVADWSKLARQYSNAGKSVSVLARETGIPEQTIRYRLGIAGIRLRPRPRPACADGPLYQRWLSMRARVRRARRQGDRVTIASEWSKFAAFREWARSHGYRVRLCLVRCDPNGAWAPDNCRFVSRRRALQQYRRPPPQKERPPRWTLKAFGEEKGLTAWSRDPRCVVTPTGLRLRLLRGWEPEDAITELPARPGALDHALHSIRAFGQTKSISAWARDRRCKVTLTGLQGRLARGISPEVAIRTPPWERIAPLSKQSHRRTTR